MDASRGGQMTVKGSISFAWSGTTNPLTRGNVGAGDENRTRTISLGS